MVVTVPAAATASLALLERVVMLVGAGTVATPVMSWLVP